MDPAFGAVNAGACAVAGVGCNSRKDLGTGGQGARGGFLGIDQRREQGVYFLGAGIFAQRHQSKGKG